MFKLINKKLAYLSHFAILVCFLNWISQGIALFTGHAIWNMRSLTSKDSTCGLIISIMDLGFGLKLFRVQLNLSIKRLVDITRMHLEKVLPQLILDLLNPPFYAKNEIILRIDFVIWLNFAVLYCQEKVSSLKIVQSSSIHLIWLC